MITKSWKTVCELKKGVVPRKHKFYCWDKFNNEVNTFEYKFELQVFLKQNEENICNFEAGKISIYNTPKTILVNFYDTNNQLQKISFFEFEQVISFAKNRNFKIKNIEFIYE